MNFVSCCLSSCPFNEQRQCRAPFLMVDLNGICVISQTGPFDNKSLVENYVEVKECNCKRCNYWERNEATGLGKCGNSDPLHFNERLKKAKCNGFEVQIEEPTFGTVVPEELDRSKQKDPPNNFLVDLK